RSPASSISLMRTSVISTAFLLFRSRRLTATADSQHLAYASVPQVGCDALSMACMTANAEVTGAAAAHLCGETVGARELEPQARDPRRQCLGCRLQLVVHVSGGLAPLPRAQRGDQCGGAARLLGRPTVTVDLSGGEPFGRIDHDEMQPAQSVD